MKRLSIEEEAALDRKVAGMYRQGFSFDAIGEAVGRSETAVWDRLHKLQREGVIQLREKSRWSDQAKKEFGPKMRRKYAENPDIKAKAAEVGKRNLEKAWEGTRRKRGKRHE